MPAARSPRRSPSCAPSCPACGPRCDREAVWLDDAAVSSDAAACDALAVGPPSGWSTERAEAIVALYRGRFLDGVAGGHRLEFEEWVLAEADRHERTLLGALGELARRYADAGRFHEAAAVAGRALRLDPYDERMHRLLLAVCEATDDRSGAIEHYRRCEDVLRRDLGVTPEPATRRAFESAMGERGVLARAS
ncbi:MAG: bacterial transcriptional activator domain-containing protein [Anaerolineae bacterium]